MDKTYPLTVGCLRRTLWFQGSLHELCCQTHRVTCIPPPATLLLYIYILRIN